MPQVGFARPEALLLLAASAILAALAAWTEMRRRRALLSFAGRGADLASVSASRRRMKLGLRILAVVLAVVALAGPYADIVERTVVQSGVDVVVALDVSQSMAVRDVDPDRLRAAKQFIQRLGDGMTQSRVALVLFAGDGIVRYPPTADARVLGEALDSVTSAFKPPGGSNLRTAVDAALKAFSTKARESGRSKAVVLLSDGEDTAGQAAPDVDALRQRNVKLLTVGVGTPSGGQIPTYDRTGRFSGYLRRADGTPIVSRLDENALRTLAERSDGRYWRLSGFPTVTLVMTELRRLDASQLGEAPGGSVPDDRYQVVLALAILALVAEELLSERRAMPSPRWLRAPGARRRLRPSFPHAVSVLLLAAVTAGGCGQVSTSEADQLYLAGDHPAALDRYRALASQHPEIPALRVNAGNALYEMGKYDPAIGEYAVGVRDGTPPVRAVAEYQRGNALFRMGKLEEAREAYKEALRVDPHDRDAKFDIEVIDAQLRATEVRPGNVPAQPDPGAEPGADAGQGQPSDQGGPGQSPGPGAASPGPPGSQGPQASGPPSNASDQTGPSLTDALRQFRSQLTADEALRLLDALMSDQKGVELLIEGPQQQQPQRPGQPPADPTY